MSHDAAIVLVFLCIVGIIAGGIAIGNRDSKGRRAELTELGFIEVEFRGIPIYIHKDQLTNLKVKVEK